MKKLHRLRLSRPARIFQIGLLLGLTSLAQFASSDDAAQSQYSRATKYSPLKQINAQNVGQLEKAWEYHTNDLPKGDMKSKLVAFEDQPSMIEGNLVVCSVKRRIIALDPATGAERWSYDPKDPLESENIGMQKCRGIGHWVDSQAEEGAACKSRLVIGTANYRLIAIDAKTGKPCEGFGTNGEVKMQPSKPVLFTGEVIATSNPAIVNDTVVVGSAVADNQRVDAPSGRVMAYDVRTGAFKWEFDPVPRKAEDPAMKSWAKGTDAFGQGNVWSSMAVDNTLDLVYLPTTSSSSDFYGGDRVGDNNYTTSIVALKGATGEVAWHFQVVHHNVFDYDVPSEPLLIDYPKDGQMVPALVQNTKMGIVFIFNRATGEPLVPIEERPVPQAGKVDGEVLSPTQPFPVGMPNVVKHGFSPDDAWGFTPIDRWLCKREIEKLNYGPIYTPVSLQGTIFSPSVGGGPNWGGGAYDPESHIMIVPSNRVPTVLQLIPRAEAEKQGPIGGGGVEGLSMTFDVKGSPYIPKVRPLLSPLGSPCAAPPWAGLTAIDIVNKKIVWDSPLGDISGMMPFKPPAGMMDTNLGMPGAGGALVTAGGLAFIGYAIDDKFRAYDMKTGKEIWTTSLPAAGVGVPVTYEANGEQYIVIPAGGHSMYGSTMGDSVVAYKLKK
jgi:quinoprotein glucose dehydrogenase